jgi:predicted nucleotidyltransferase
LVQTVGLLGRLGTALSGLARVDQAFVFGSWAARYLAEPGPAPRDIDILVIGDAALAAVRRACGQVEQELRVEVNPFVVSGRLWTEEPTEPFLAEVKSRALVRVRFESS